MPRSLSARHAADDGSTARNATKNRRIMSCYSRLIWLLIPELPSAPPFSPHEVQTFACKKCKKCFRKDAREFEESDEYCPHCDNHFVLEALTPKPALKIEGEDARVDSRMLKDERVRQEEERTIFNVKDAPNRLG
ncbi:hypothetical protein RJZ56_007842 [Blastomyces dermatitidis]